jgi:hypothetical protein
MHKRRRAPGKMQRVALLDSPGPPAVRLRHTLPYENVFGKM